MAQFPPPPPVFVPPGFIRPMPTAGSFQNPASFFPAPGRILPSPTASQHDKALKADHVYSAILLQHGGTGQQRFFTVPFGQTIPRLNGSGITVPTEPHQLTYTERTTNLSKAGEVGSSIGDVVVKNIAISFEQAAYTVSGASAGAARTFGGTQFEINDVMSKCFFQIKVGGNTQSQSQIFAYPGMGTYGSIMTTGSGVTVSSLTNGVPGSRRGQQYPIPIARNDTLEGIWGVASSSALAFSVTSGIGQPMLADVNLDCGIIADVRG